MKTNGDIRFSFGTAAAQRCCGMHASLFGAILFYGASIPAGAKTVSVAPLPHLSGHGELYTSAARTGL